MRLSNTFSTCVSLFTPRITARMAEGRPPTLAVLLSGQVRTFVHDSVRNSFCGNVLDALCPDRQSCRAVELFLCAGSGRCGSMAQQNGQHADVQAAEYQRVIMELQRCSRTVTPHVAYFTPPEQTTAHRSVCDESLSSIRCGEAEKAWCSGPRRRCDEHAAVHPALAAWNATVVGIRRGRGSSRNPVDPARLALVAAGKPLPLHKSQLGILRWMGCLAQLEARERARPGGRFDWVVVARFDLTYFAPLPPLRAFAANGAGVHLPANHVSPLNDFFALMPRRHAGAYLSAASQACCNACWLRAPPLPWDGRTLARSARLKTPGLSLDVIPNGPEQWLGAQLYVQGVPVYAGYLPLALTRWATFGTAGAPSPARAGAAAPRAAAAAPPAARSAASATATARATPPRSIIRRPRRATCGRTRSPTGRRAQRSAWSCARGTSASCAAARMSSREIAVVRRACRRFSWDGVDD